MGQKDFEELYLRMHQFGIIPFLSDLDIGDVRCDVHFDVNVIYPADPQREGKTRSDAHTNSVAQDISEGGC